MAERDNIPPDLEKLDRERGHKLLDEETRRRLPPLYSGKELGLNGVAQVKLFTPDSNYAWYASEFDGKEVFFGLIIGQEIELVYFALSELREMRGPLGLLIERDLYFEPTSLRELIDQHLSEDSQQQARS